MKSLNVYRYLILHATTDTNIINIGSDTDIISVLVQPYQSHFFSDLKYLCGELKLSGSHVIVLSDNSYLENILNL